MFVVISRIYMLLSYKINIFIFISTYFFASSVMHGVICYKVSPYPRTAQFASIYDVVVTAPLLVCSIFNAFRHNWRYHSCSKYHLEIEVYVIGLKPLKILNFSDTSYVIIYFTKNLQDFLKTPGSPEVWKEVDPFHSKPIKQQPLGGFQEIFQLISVDYFCNNLKIYLRRSKYALQNSLSTAGWLSRTFWGKGGLWTGPHRNHFYAIPQVFIQLWNMK